MEEVKNTWYKNKFFAALFLILFLIIIALSSLDANQPIKTEKIESSEHCLSVPENLTMRLDEGLNTEGTYFRSAKAFKAPERENAYFVSADLEGPGLEGVSEIATFATNDLELGGFVSVDGIALEFTNWANGQESDFGFRVTEKGVKESKDCVISSLEK